VAFPVEVLIAKGDEAVTAGVPLDDPSVIVGVPATEGTVITAVPEVTPESDTDPDAAPVTVTWVDVTGPVMLVKSSAGEWRRIGASGVIVAPGLNAPQTIRAEADRLRP
jgi:hypothetical protein